MPHENKFPNRAHAEINYLSKQDLTAPPPPQNQIAVPLTLRSKGSNV